MAAERVVSSCRRCGSPFLRPAGLAAQCRSCGYLHVLGGGVRLAEDLPLRELTTIEGHTDLPDGLAVRQVRRVAGACSQVVPVQVVDGELVPLTVEAAAEAMGAVVSGG